MKKKQLEESDPCLEYVMAYYDEHKTFEGIPEKVTIAGKEYNTRAFFSHVRTNYKKYQSGKNSKGSNSSTALRRYSELAKRHFDFDPKNKNATIADDKYIRCLQAYYDLHHTLENVPKTLEFEGEELNILEYLADRRKKHQKKILHPEYIPSTIEQQRWSALDSMHYQWNIHQIKKDEYLDNDPYMEYLKWHYKKYKTINDITAGLEVTFAGTTLKIGAFVNDCRKKYQQYQAALSKNEQVELTPLYKSRFKELNNMFFEWRPSETKFSAERHAKEHDVNASTLKRYIKKFNGNVEKATIFAKAARKKTLEQSQNSKTNKLNLKTVMHEFDIDIDNLVSLLCRNSLRISQGPQKPLMYDENTNLREFCIANGLNYTVIQKAIKLKSKGLCDEDLQSLINRTICEYKIQGQQKPSTWIYSKYGNETLVRHLLLSMNLDPEAILTDMTKNCLTLAEAIENDCIKRETSPQTRYLEPLYHDLISFYNKVNHSEEYTQETAPTAIIDYVQQLINDYQLNEEEFNILKNAFIHYTSSIETYKLYDIGFEKEPEKRVEKILKYQLDDDEIEEAFFLPLRFDQKVLIGRDNELYKRRVILKNLTVSWSTLTPEEQQTKICQYDLTGEELGYIVKTRHEIDETKAKVHSKN